MERYFRMDKRILRTGIFIRAAALIIIAAFPETVFSQVIIANDNGKIPVIVTRRVLSTIEEEAVKDLQYYLARMTEQKIERKSEDSLKSVNNFFPIYLGNISENKRLMPIVKEKCPTRDGFVIDVAEKSIHIIGRSKFGTAYGVYELLEKTGIRWLFPGQWGEVVPVKSSISLPVGRTVCNPVFMIRTMASWSNGAASRFKQWARRQKMNMSGFGGHSSLMKKYLNIHPEWYALIGGKRRNRGEFKLCHSNRKMVKQAIKEVLNGIVKQNKRNSDYWIYSISPTDGGGFCQCENCKRMGSVSDRLQIFANEIADAVAKEFPGKYIAYYGAYSEAKNPPSVVARPNVVVFVTTWQKNLFKSLSSSENKKFRDLLIKFSKTCPKIAIRDYDGMFSCWWGYGPISLIDVHRYDYPWYAKHNIIGFDTEAQDHWAAAGQSYYVLAKLMWNPYADIDAIKRDFVEKGFGRAFGPMWRYYERINKERGFLQQRTIILLRNDLEQAAKLAQRDDVRKRINYLRLYYYLLDALQRGSSGKLDAEQSLIAARIAKTLRGKNIIFNGMIRDIIKMCKTYTGKDENQISVMSSDELNNVLKMMIIPKPGKAFPRWKKCYDYQLLPLDKDKSDYSEDMGINFRYGPATILIYEKAGRVINVLKRKGKYKNKEMLYELIGPEQNVIRKGFISFGHSLVAHATSTGIYKLLIRPGSAWAYLTIRNRYAVIKASSVNQHLHPIGSCMLYFYVPKGTKEFAFVGKADKGEPYALTIWGPYNSKSPVYPRTLTKSTNWIEHRIKVPSDTDGQIWRFKLEGEDKAFFLEGIPPFMSNDPKRLLYIRR